MSGFSAWTWTWTMNSLSRRWPKLPLSKHHPISITWVPSGSPASALLLLLLILKWKIGERQSRNRLCFVSPDDTNWALKLYWAPNPNLKQSYSELTFLFYRVNWNKFERRWLVFIIWIISKTKLRKKIRIGIPVCSSKVLQQLFPFLYHCLKALPGVLVLNQFTVKQSI